MSIIDRIIAFISALLGRGPVPLEQEDEGSVVVETPVVDTPVETPVEEPVEVPEEVVEPSPEDPAEVPEEVPVEETTEVVDPAEPGDVSAPGEAPIADVDIDLDEEVIEDLDDTTVLDGLDIGGSGSEA